MPETQAVFPNQVKASIPLYRTWLPCSCQVVQGRLWGIVTNVNNQNEAINAIYVRVEGKATPMQEAGVAHVATRKSKCCKSMQRKANCTEKLRKVEIWKNIISTKPR